MWWDLLGLAWLGLAWLGLDRYVICVVLFLERFFSLFNQSNQKCFSFFFSPVFVLLSSVAFGSFVKSHKRILPMVGSKNQFQLIGFKLFEL